MLPSLQNAKGSRPYCVVDTKEESSVDGHDRRTV